MSSEDSKVPAILRHLSEKTKSGQIPWEPGEDPNAFAVSLPSFTVGIQRMPATEQEPDDFTFRISNEDLPLVELSAFEAKALGFADMQEFFYAARRTALHLDEVFDTLSLEIEDLLEQE